MIKNEIKEAFDFIAEDYDSFMEKTYHTRAQKKVVSKLREEISGRVLDIGTGAGIIANAAAKISGTRVTASDLSGEMVAKAVKNATYAGVDVDFLINDAEAAPFQDHVFDIVISCLGLLWYRDKERAFKEMIRVCRKNGKIIIIEEQGSPKRGRAGQAVSSRLLKFFSTIEKLETPISLREVEEKMLKQGLRVTRRVKAKIDEDHGFVGMVFQR